MSFFFIGSFFDDLGLEMAEKLNMSQQVYSRIENDQKKVGHDEVEK